MAIQIHTERFLLRELSENDVTSRYLGWLQDDATKVFIVAATKTNSLESLRQYIRDRFGREDILFLGIFDKKSGLHIGNIKYEPVNGALGYAVMGILIGDPAYRSQGLGAEVLRSSARWLKSHRNIRQILLGVKDDNIAAIKSYEKVGFNVAESPYLPKAVPDQIIMTWNIPD